MPHPMKSAGVSVNLAPSVLHLQPQGREEDSCGQKIILARKIKGTNTTILTHRTSQDASPCPRVVDVVCPRGWSPATSYGICAFTMSQLFTRPKLISQNLLPFNHVNHEKKPFHFPPRHSLNFHFKRRLGEIAFVSSGTFFIFLFIFLFPFQLFIFFPTVGSCNG